MRTPCLATNGLLQFSSAMAKFYILLIFISIGFMAAAQDTLTRIPARAGAEHQANDLKANKVLNVGGEIRYQYFHYKNPGWGDEPSDPDGFILTRALLHADLKINSRLRTYLELQSSLADGQVDNPSPLDRNPLEAHQVFAEWLIRKQQENTFKVRIGRQELSYGSQRLLSVREGPNNRQSFDAVKLSFSKKNFSADGFYGHYVLARPGIFDDRPGNGVKLWGGYVVFNQVPILSNVDIYYLGLSKNSAKFDDGAGPEVRHSFGTRIWQSNGDWLYDIESLYQFGSLASSEISAWTASANISYTFRSAALKPQVGLKTELISGDRQHGDGRLNTFNPLFPKGAYFGLAALIGPVNLIDTHPYFSLSITKHLVWSEDYDMFWRMNRDDGIYAVSGKLLYTGQQTISKKIGHQLGSALEYTPNDLIYIRAELTWFNAGKYLKEVGAGKNILMSGITATYKF
jgi:hypothetical protein